MSQSRVILENLSPEINAGRFYAKRVIGNTFRIEIDLFTDGHDVVNGHLLYRQAGKKRWNSTQLTFLGNDRWTGEFTLDKPGLWEYKVQGWIDYALNWQHGIESKIADGQEVAVELADGIPYLKYLIKKTKGEDKATLKTWVSKFAESDQYEAAKAFARSEELHKLFLAHPEKRFKSEYPVRQVFVDRKKAEFSTWYELFPRSASTIPGQHGTLKDVEALLPRIAEFGFDTLYVPPIHPIGKVNRKGKNNSVTSEAGEPGSCWGVGSDEGGHLAIHPELGTLADFKSLVKKAAKHEIEIAMDIAFQAAPDHPWVKEHPSWFKWRSDGSVQYAENPPKKYQDILPIYFETKDWQELWDELTGVFLYWMKQGIRVFRVDNPHTKPYLFWEYLIAKCKEKDAGVIFLSEAFSRPAVMHQLAKVGFTQSYCYYPWRNTKHEIQEYMQELTQGPGKDYFRPNFWPNTPDILPWALQKGEEPTYLVRYFMAATLAASVGVYGPVYEFLVNDAVQNKEEYWDSEKYEVRNWDWSARNKVTEVYTKVNQARKDNPALQQLVNYQACQVDNDQLLAWYKWDDSGENHLLMVANIDPQHTQSGWVQTPLAKLGIEEGSSFEVQDLMSNATYTWNQEWNYVELNPHVMPFHLFAVKTQQSNQHEHNQGQGAHYAESLVSHS